MAVVDIFGYQYQRLVASMELDAAVELACQSAQTLQPTVEARLKLSPGGHYHLDAAQGGHGLDETRKHDLTVQTIVKALDEFSPETRVGIGMDVHTHDNLGTGKLAESVLDASWRAVLLF